MYWADPHLYTRVMSLPILEISVIPILGAFTQNSFEEAVNIQVQQESELGQAFEAQKSLFDQTKKIYSRNKAFLSADELNIVEPEHRSKIRMANLATFVASVFGSQEVGFYELNDNFVDIFTPEAEPLTKDPAALFLNLKVQMFITALSEEEQEKTKEDHLEELFPANLDQTLSARHPEKPLHADELEFIREMQSMQEYLRAEAGDLESISSLSSKYKWEDFLRGLRDHLRKAYEHSIIEPYMQKNGLNFPAPKPVKAEPEELNLDFLEEDIKMATQAALQSFTQYSPQPNPGQYSSHYPPQQSQIPPNGFNSSQFQPTHGQGNGGPVPYPTQTAPTQVLYEQARQAAVAKSSPHSRRPGLPSQRRPWSTEEENALMAGLDKVKGPHWSQILLLYGPKGSVSEILKDRNQVQLKDKARNLKLFFLKNNIEVPYYLQTVTGELKTRAPTQAARREAEDKSGLDMIGLQGGGHASPTSQHSILSSPGSPTSQSGPGTYLGPNETAPGDSSIEPPKTEAGVANAEQQPALPAADDEIDFEKTLLDAMQQHNALEAAANDSGGKTE